MATTNFDINDALRDYMSDPTQIPTPEADSALLHCESDPESLTNQLLNSVLNPIVDAVADSPDAILRASNFDSLQLLLKYAIAAPSTRYDGLTLDSIVRKSTDSQ